MACGVCLGIVLISLIQAEHGSCSGASRGSSWLQNGDGYVGFSQQDGRLRGLDGFPQDQLRQAGSPRSSYSSGLRRTGAGAASSPGLFTARSTKTVPQPSLTSRLFSKPNRPAASAEVKSPVAPKKRFQLSTAIASGSSVSKTSRKNSPSVQGSFNTAWRPASALTAKEASPLRPAHNPSDAGSNANYKPQSGSSKFFAHAPPTGPRQAPTSVSSPGRKVTLQYRPVSSWRKSATAYESSRPTYQRPGPNPEPSYSNVMQSTNWRAQTRPESHRPSGGQRLAPSKTHRIPKRFGGAVIRRHSASSKPKPVAVKKQQRTPEAPPQWTVPYKQASRLQGDRKVMKSKLF